MALGKKTSATIASILTTATDIFIIPGLMDASGILLRLSGGSNAANGLTALTAQLGDALMTQGGSAGPLLTPVETLGNVRTNKVLPNGDYIMLLYQPGGAGTPSEKIRLPSCALRMTMSTAVSNNVLVEAWPYFDFVHQDQPALPTA